jgi:hypothetical protein
MFGTFFFSLLCSHLAWRAKRSYVFQDYIWHPPYYPWHQPAYPRPRNPLTTLISGPTAGGPWGALGSDDSPRAISSDWFDVVCPMEERMIINSDTGKDPVRWNDAKVVMDHWVELLQSTKARCVEVVPTEYEKDNFPQTFDLW